MADNQASSPTVDTTVASDKTVEAPAAGPVTSVPASTVAPASAVDPGVPVPVLSAMPLSIYLKIREVPEWAWKAREIFPPAIGHTMHTLQEWDDIFVGF